MNKKLKLIRCYITNIIKDIVEDIILPLLCLGSLIGILYLIGVIVKKIDVYYANFSNILGIIVLVGLFGFTIQLFIVGHLFEYFKKLNSKCKKETCECKNK